MCITIHMWRERVQCEKLFYIYDPKGIVFSSKSLVCLTLRFHAVWKATLHWKKFALLSKKITVQSFLYFHTGQDKTLHQAINIEIHRKSKYSFQMWLYVRQVFKHWKRHGHMQNFLLSILSLVMFVIFVSKMHSTKCNHVTTQQP